MTSDAAAAGSPKQQPTSPDQLAEKAAGKIQYAFDQDQIGGEVGDGGQATTQKFMQEVQNIWKQPNGVELANQLWQDLGRSKDPLQMDLAMVWLNDDAPPTKNQMLTSDDLTAITKGPATTPEQLLGIFSAQWILDNPSGLLVPNNDEPGMSQYSYVSPDAASSLLFYMDPGPGNGVKAAPDQPMPWYEQIFSDV